jgi:hypothetical protein
MELKFDEGQRECSGVNSVRRNKEGISGLGSGLFRGAMYALYSN